MRVLVVDDNATNLRILSDTLTGWHMRPVVAGSGADALEALRQASRAGQGFPLMLLDLCMPDMDGLMVADEARVGIEPRPAIIMLSSAARAREATGRGIVRTLLKPVGRDELFDAIAAAVSTRPVGVLAAETATSPFPTAAIRPLRILLAEDNIVNQRVAVAILIRLGHTVAVAANGLEAVAAVEREFYDVVVMDVQMPEMGGFEATAAIRRLQGATTRTPIIAMTAHAMTGDRERCLEAGMDGYVAKPIDARLLIDEFERVLD
jgi:CheY-like chemotaxis protein